MEDDDWYENCDTTIINEIEIHEDVWGPDYDFDFVEINLEFFKATEPHSHNTFLKCTHLECVVRKVMTS
jgi:hypothetical protein